MRTLLLLLALLALAVLPGCHRPPPPPVPELRLAAAADLQFALPELIAAWAPRHPEVHAVSVFGASGTLVAQIENGAPFDLFLSADQSRVERLEKAGRTVPGTSFLYAAGHVALWVQNEVPRPPADSPLSVLTRPEIRKVALAHPEHAPYGAAAMACLQAAGLLPAVEGKLVRGENVAQAAQFAESGSVEAALISASLARAPRLQAAGWSVVVPGPALPQAGVILRRSTQEPAARAFFDFLRSPEGVEILRRHGLPPPER